MKKRLARSAGGDGNGQQPAFIHCSGNCSNADRELYLKAGADMVW